MAGNGPVIDREGDCVYNIRYTYHISLPLQRSLLGLLVTYKARRTKPGRLLSQEEFRDSGHQTSGSSVAACPVCDSVSKVTFDVLVLLCNAPLCSLSSTSKCLPRTALQSTAPPTLTFLF